MDSNIWIAVFTALGTIVGLGAFVHTLFKGMKESIDKRFDIIDKRFEAVDKRFEAVDKRFEAIDKKFEMVFAELRSIREDIAKLDLRLTKLEVIVQERAPRLFHITKETAFAEEIKEN